MKGRFYFNKGFTLIELLVVMSIISLLSSIVFASLNTARAKAKDSAIREQIVQYRNLLELNKNETNSYAQLQPTQGNPYWFDGSSSGSTSCYSYFSGNYATQARDICKSLANLSGQFIYIGLYPDASSMPTRSTTDYYSLTVHLPYKNVYLCLGSTGTSESASQDNSFAGCSSNP